MTKKPGSHFEWHDLLSKAVEHQGRHDAVCDIRGPLGR
jgi:hypothetical protein